MTWKSLLTRLAFTIEIGLDTLKYRLQRGLGRLGPVQLVAYRGHGTADEFRMLSVRRMYTCTIVI